VISLFNLIWPKIVDIQTAEHATRYGLYRSVLGICEFILLVHTATSTGIEPFPINLALIWVVVGALVFYKLRLGAFILFGIEIVISYLKYKYVATAISFLSISLLIYSAICIVLTISAIRGIIKYNKFKAEQTQATTDKHLSKANIMARIIEFAFFAFFALLAYVLSKP
jgi:hypothetical protein